MQGTKPHVDQLVIWAVFRIPMQIPYLFGNPRMALKDQTESPPSPASCFTQEPTTCSWESRKQQDMKEIAWLPTCKLVFKGKLSVDMGGFNASQSFEYL